MVLAPSDKISRVLPYSGYYRSIHTFHLLDFHHLWYAVPKHFCYVLIVTCVVLTPSIFLHWFGLFCFRSPLLTESIVFFLLLWVLRCFSSPRLASHTLCIHVWILELLTLAGSPIRISVTITDICSSSQLFAACHVLLRLLMPRHSPYALISLT